jgi:hypothetical protein
MRRFLKQFKSTRLRKNIGLFLKLTPIMLEIFLPLSILPAFSGLNDTISSFSFPLTFIKKDFTLPNPYIQYSFFIQNNHYVPLTTLEVSVVIDVQYFKNFEDKITNIRIFEKYNTYNNIPPSAQIIEYINATAGFFLLYSLSSFLTEVNLSRESYNLISLEFNGFFALENTQFQISLINLNITNYETP